MTITSMASTKAQSSARPSAVPSDDHVKVDETKSASGKSRKKGKVGLASRVAKASIKQERSDLVARKRKRASPKKTKEAISPICQPPTHILVIDNGGDTLKYGLVTANEPDSIPNLTAKLKHQWTVMIGDEVTQIQPNQVENLTRSTERSHITKLGNQMQVWKRILDLMRIHVPLTSEASQLFGWKNIRPTSKTEAEVALYNPQTMAVLILVAPSSPRSTMESIYSIWFDDFNFGHVGLATSALFAAPETLTGCSCVVDLGWSASYAVPTVDNRAVVEGIRRMPIGGRHLVNLWKYYMSYRQWNLMDSEFILRDVHEQLSFLSMNFEGEMDVAQRLRSGRRPFDRSFALPDFQNTFKGSVRLPFAMATQQAMKELEQKTIESHKKIVTNDEEELVIEETGKEATNGSDEGDRDDGDMEEIDDEVDSEEEDDEQRKFRLIRQRAAEERRKTELDNEEQLLEISVERFTIPEVLFRPTDAGFPPVIAGLPQTIVQAIQACPRQYQAALFGSIRLVGGMASMSNIQARLERELRSLAPTQYDVNISNAEFPRVQAWLGASKWAKRTPFQQWSISKEEYERSKSNPNHTKAWRRLYHCNGGHLI